MNGEGKKKKIKEFFGINQSMLSMLVMVILLGLGEKMGERFLPLYLVAVGGSAYAVGALNAMDNFLSAIYAFVGGVVSDKLGYKKALMTYTLIAMLGYLIVILFPFWQAVLLGAVFFISWTALSLPAILSLVSSTVKQEKQTMGVSLHSLVRRIPMALGPVLGGLLITYFGIHVGARISFGAAFLLGLVSLWVIHRFIEDKTGGEAKMPPIKETFLAMSKPLRILLASDILIRFAEQIPYAFVVIWVVKNNGFSPSFFSVLTVVEMVVAMLIYIPVAYLSEKTSSKLTISITFVFFTLFPFVLLFSNTHGMLFLAFVIRGLKEFGEPTRKALIVKLSKEKAKASTFGTYYLLRDVVVSVAALFSASLWQMGPQVNFLTAGCFGILGTLLFVIFGKDEREGA